MRLLVWNIQFFSIKRVQRAGQDFLKQVQAECNRDHIIGTVKQADPDVFVIIEPRSKQPLDIKAVGELASDGGGPLGLIYLYELLNKVSDKWYLVPPLKTVCKDVHSTTYTETVGIFYRGDRFNFIGPWVWPAAAAKTGPSVPPGQDVEKSNYPDPWGKMLPKDTQWASQARFYNSSKEIWFPDVGDRRPVLTSFQQIGGAAKVYKIFACHTPPNTNAKAATARILSTDLREGWPGANEVVVFAGDFNVDNLDESGNEFLRSVPDLYYADVVLGAKENGPTTTKRVPDATPSSYLKAGALDNFFVRVRRSSLKYFYAPGTYNAAVIDQTAGSVRFPTDMFHPLKTFETDSMFRDTAFRLAMNYGHIGNHPGTSDHLAIIADI